eukprot:351698-Chlamydomonas_euryale.AAC.3
MHAGWSAVHAAAPKWSKVESRTTEAEADAADAAAVSISHDLADAVAAAAAAAAPRWPERLSCCAAGDGVGVPMRRLCRHLQ